MSSRSLCKASDSAIITAVKCDGTEYNVLRLLRSLEQLDITLNIYTGVFAHPPGFDLLQELEVSSNLIFDASVNDNDLERCALEYFSDIIGHKFKSILYIDHNDIITKMPLFTPGLSVYKSADIMTPTLRQFILSSISPELARKVML